MPHRQDRAIGIFDSGIGGLTVLQAIARTLPAEHLLYLGDTARVPYGAKSPATVTRFSIEVVRYLMRQPLKMLVIACNTASACSLGALVETVDPAGGIPVVGVIGPGAHAALAATHNGRVGVLGTESTIRQGAYQRVLQSMAPGLQVYGQACPLFVPLAEEGWTDNEVSEATARRYLEPLLPQALDTLILGCTHYPLLKPTIARVMGEHVTLIDSAEATAREVQALLSTRGLLRQDREPGRRHFMVTDAPERFARVGEKFLGAPLGDVELVTLSETKG
ncbi:MAG: glutamate racemase [Myxococcota bacterium]